MGTIIFDFDGVLVDSLESLFLAWKQIAEEFDAKIKITNIEQYKGLFKNNVIKMLESIGLSEKELERSGEIYFEHVNKNSPKLFEGIKDVLEELSKKHTLVLVSGSSKGVIEKKLQEGGVLKLFKLIIPLIKTQRNKPDPYHINLAIEKLKVRPEEIIYIGDTAEDIQAAKSANIKDILGVSYGFGSVDSLTAENPTKIVGSPKEILNFINKSGKK